ncbi:hypothetical protein [Streptomyces sp. NPDC002044]|uniref:hypothetical protein n=1 Tax=Streptomyces sp. NPDC002044 TaxID=3154662 RepID=UPI00332A275C
MPGQFTRSGRTAQAPSPTGTPGRWERLISTEDEAEFHAHLRAMRTPRPAATGRSGSVRERRPGIVEGGVPGY